MTTNAPESGNVRVWEDIPEPVPQRFNPMGEFGVTGLKRTAGIIDEEFLPALRGRKAIAVFREMSMNDSIVGALLFAIDKLCRQVEWEVTSSDNTPEAKEAAEFVEQCMNDMSHSWDDFISEILSMLVYGWSWHEIVYKKRLGPWETDPKKKSQYDDGKIGWRKMPIRSQETMLRWVFDKTGDVQALIQLAPPAYQMTTIPLNKSILFRTRPAKGNPEGVSILRTAYRSWYFKKRLEEFEGIGIERDLAGMPVARVPADYLEAERGTKKAKVVDGFRKMVRGVRRDENEGLILPTQYDPETKQPLFDFELMSSSGARQFDTNAIIQRYEQRILMSVLADFILVGHEGVGSYAMHTDKSGIFRAAMNSITGSIADTLNRHAIPKLFEVNGWRVRELPKIVPNQVDPPDLSQLAQFISATSASGMQWFPDPELEKFIRDIAHLPEIPDEQLEMKRQLAMQEQAMGLADSQMQLLGMEQRAELLGHGYSPEQADMAMNAVPGELGHAQQMNEIYSQTEAANYQNQNMAPPPLDPNAMQQHELGMQQMGAQDQMDQAKFERQMQMLAAQQQGEDARVAREDKLGAVKGKHEDLNLKREQQRMAFQSKADEAAMAREQKKMAFQGKHEDSGLKREQQRMSMQSKHEAMLAQLKGKAEEAGVKRQVQLHQVKESGEASKHKRALEQAKLKAAQAKKPEEKKKPGSKK